MRSLRITGFILIIMFLILCIPINTTNLFAADLEKVFLKKVMDSDYKAIIVRTNGDMYLIEYGIGVLSIWRYEGRYVHIYSPGLFAGIGSKIMLLDDDKEARIWDSEYIGVDNDNLLPTTPVVPQNPQIVTPIFTRFAVCEDVTASGEPINPSDKFKSSIQKINYIGYLNAPANSEITCNWYYLGNEIRELIHTNTNKNTGSNIYWFWMTDSDFVNRYGNWECEMIMGTNKHTMKFTLENAFASGISVNINGSIITFRNQPQLVNGRLLVPFREIGEELGATIHWDDLTRQVTLQLLSKSVVLKLDSNYATVDGQKVELDAPARIINNATYVPLRFIGETLGASVNWDQISRIVYVDK